MRDLEDGTGRDAHGTFLRSGHFKVFLVQKNRLRMWSVNGEELGLREVERGRRRDVLAQASP